MSKVVFPLGKGYHYPKNFPRIAPHVTNTFELKNILIRQYSFALVDQDLGLSSTSKATCKVPESYWGSGEIQKKTKDSR
ncbi:MAG: hypothetical protein AAGA18_02865 [Verrucomicrobiota bacterium]